MRTPAKERAMRKQIEKRKALKKPQCNVGYVKPEFLKLLDEMRPGYTSNEACLHAALLELKALKE